MSARKQLIIITGFMGAGKTTVAAALARRLACAMIDLDQLINEREGRTPQMIIDEDSEPTFREIESAALRDALAIKTARIIALGGGTWTIADNRVLINQHAAFTIWLDAPFELCRRRIKSGNLSRPLARDLESARRLYDERRAVYDQATLRVRVNEEKSADAIAAEIADALPRSTEEQTKQGKL
jgi:shikimate kinase